MTLALLVEVARLCQLTIDHGPHFFTIVRRLLQYLYFLLGGIQLLLKGFLFIMIRKRLLSLQMPTHLQRLLQQ